MRTLGDTFFDQLVKNLVSPIAQKAAAQVTSSQPVQQALIEAQDAAKKAQMLAWALGITWGLTFVFYVVPRMEKPIPRVWRRR